MKHLILSLISALLLSIAWPTYGVVFFLFFALVPLLLAEHEISLSRTIKNKASRIFALSYLTFLIWNITTTGWLYGSKNPDGSNALLAVALPVTVNALFYSVVFILYHYYKKWQGTYWGLVFFVALWMAFEKLHLEWELTWPWLNLGNAFSENPELVQWYEYVGATGGSLWILLTNVFGFYSVRVWETTRKRKALKTNLALLLALMVVPMGLSLYRYHTYTPEPKAEVSVVLLQPDLDPYNEKYQKDSLEILSELLLLAHGSSATKVDYYIGPETSVPGQGSISVKGLEKSVLLGEIRTFLSDKPGAVFTTGISSHRFYGPGEQKGENAYQTSYGDWVESYNSAAQIAPGEPTQIYHKGKLVPGVEIFPYMDYLKPLLGDAMLNFGGTVASLGKDPERRVFSNPYNPGRLAPLICYESVYGEFTAEYVQNGANFLAIMTNDSWWGVSEGHRQLLSYARLRAIETRREIARSANSGISAHINSRGDIVSDTFYGDQTTLSAQVTLLEEITFYTRTGDLLSRISLFVLGFLIFYTLISKIQNRKKSVSLPRKNGPTV